MSTRDTDSPRPESLMLRGEASLGDLSRRGERSRGGGFAGIFSGERGVLSPLA